MVIPSTLSVDPGQGVTIGFNIGNANTLYAYWSNLFADLHTLGCTWIRLNYSWKNIERTQGVYTWTVLDDAVTNINAAGFNMMYCLRDAPTWALTTASQKSSSEPHHLPDPTLMAGFASAVVSRYNGGVHGHIDAIGYNEDFNISFTSTSDTLHLNQNITNAGGPYTSFAITAAANTADPGTLIYFGGYGNTTDVATVSTAVNAGDTTVHINSFTPAVTYSTGTNAKVAYVIGAHSSAYDLYNPGAGGVTTNLKSQPDRDGYYAAQVMLAVTPAVRAVNPTLPIGTPCIWWMQPSNPSGFPSGLSNMTAYLTEIYNTAGSVIDAYTFLDGHYYSNGVDPAVGNNQTSTIAQWMADISAVSASFSDTGRQIWVSEFGWQSDTTTSSSTTVAPGSVTITCGRTEGAANGGTAIIDSGGNQETVTITAHTFTTITATFTKSHSGTYTVVIPLDCSEAQQSTNYSTVLNAVIPGANSNKNKAFFFSLWYDPANYLTGGELEYWNGSSYTYKPAFTTLKNYLATHPVTQHGYSATILADSPQAYYRLEEKSGLSAADSSGNGYTATLAGVLNYNVPGIEYGSSSTAISFTASGGLKVPNSLQVYTWNAASLEFWISDTSLGWRHVVMTTYNASGTTLLYLDGAATGSGAGGPVYIDQLFDFAGTLTASRSVDEVAIYNYPLSPGQVAAHYAAALPQGQMSVSIAGMPAIFDESTMQVQYTENERWRAQCTILDYAGTQTFAYRSQVSISDKTLGLLYTGFLIDDTFDKSNTFMSGAIEHKIDCIGNESLFDKRTSNRLYSVPTPSAQIALDMLNDVGVAEGVKASYAMLEVNTQSAWQAGTLSGAVGAATIPGGDLELSPAGTNLTTSESTTSNFSQGTLTNVQATNNTLQLQSYSGLSMTATCIGNVGNAFTYWAVYNTNTSQPNDWLLEYTMWIDGSSPEIKAGVDVIYTDGSALRLLNSNVGQYDQHGIGSHPQNDLKGWANNQWMYRRIGLYPFTGKTIDYIAVSFESDQAGNFGAYFQSIKLTYLGVTQIDVIGSFTGGNVAGSNGYSNIIVKNATVYAQSGSRVSPSHGIASVGILQNSLQSWTVNTPANTTFNLAVSLDGGATYWNATNKTAIGIITAGTSLVGKALLIQESMALTGNTPLVTPSLSAVAISLMTSYASTQNDVLYTRSTTANFNAGTLTNLLASNSILGLNGWWRDWANSDVTTLANDQTVWGGFSPSQNLNYNQLVIKTNSGGDARVQLVGAGNTWQDFTMAVTIQVPVANANVGFVYRTTGWQSPDNTFAYVVTVSTTGIQLGRGTNTGGGAGAYTNIQTASITLTPNDFYTLKVVVSGNSHTVYLSDVQYISATDSTYPSAGYVGLRTWNTSGGTISTFYGSFALVKALTGTYVSENLSLNSVGTVGNSRIFWQDIVPGNATALFETSIDGKSTWQTATYGQQISGLSPGTNVTGKNLNVRITLTANSEQDQVQVSGYSAWITSPFSSSGTYTSPSLSLSTVTGSVGNTLASWAALQPNNTSVLADTSIDGGSTWQTNVAPGSLVTTGTTQYAGLGSIANITTQPAVTTDGFTSNTSANYTSGFQTGGSAATWTFDTANSRVVATGGSNTSDVYNGISVANVDILVDLDYADAAGVILCRSGASTYYVLRVHDNSSSISPTGSMRLSRNGTLVAHTPINFIRGLIYRLRVTIVAGVITAVFDGVTTLSYTDGSPLVAGTAGLSTDGGTAHFRNLWLQPLGDVVSSKSLLMRLRLSSTDATVTPQVQNLVGAAYGSQIGTGTLIPSADYRNTFVNANMDDISKQSNYKWHIDQFNQLYFTGSQAIPSPWVLQSNALALPSDLEVDTNLAVETLGDLYRNRQTLKGVQNNAVFTDTFIGNGFTTSFNLKYPVLPGTHPQATLFVHLNGIAQTIGLQGGTTVYNWYYAENSPTIAQDTSGIPLTSSDTLLITYVGAFTTTITVDNTSAQTALAAIEGGSGIVEAVEDVSSRNMSYAAGTTYANQLLTRYCITGQKITFKTYRNGLAVGQTLSVYIPEEQLNYAQMLIHKIDLKMQTQPNNTVLYNYIVEASELPKESSFAKLIADNLLQ